MYEGPSVLTSLQQPVLSDYGLPSGVKWQDGMASFGHHTRPTSHGRVSEPVSERSFVNRASLLETQLSVERESQIHLPRQAEGCLWDKEVGELRCGER